MKKCGASIAELSNKKG